MAAGTTLLHLLVLLLGFSHLISMNAIPVTRTRSLIMQATHDATQVVSEGTTLLENSAKVVETGAISGRMIVEVNDYPGSGANNRHTPKAQVGRVCVDC